MHISIPRNTDGIKSSGQSFARGFTKQDLKYHSKHLPNAPAAVIFHVADLKCCHAHKGSCYDTQRSRVAASPCCERKGFNVKRYMKVKKPFGNGLVFLVIVSCIATHDVISVHTWWRDF